MGKVGKLVVRSLLALCYAAGTALGAIIPLSPIGGDVVCLLPEAQRRIMSIAAYDTRLDVLREDREGGGKEFGDDGSRWRVSAPLILRWRTTDDEDGPWRIAIGEDVSSAEASVWWVEDAQGDVDNDGSRIWKWTVPRPNLKLGTTYHWRAWSDVKCKEGHAHGSVMDGKCAICGKASSVRESGVASFSTDAQPPRWISLEGRVKNIRDLGGWKTLAGLCVRQGMVFRGQGLNDNSPNGESPGRNRLMVEDVIYMKKVLGIKTDLDLRNERETAKLERSPIGDDVAYIRRASPLYNGIFNSANGPDWVGAEGKRAMAANFRVFCDRRNYPIYFHCIGGADRTGSLAYVLNGILGVSRHDLEVDWESTFYPVLPEMEKNFTGSKYWRRKQYFDEGFMKYGDEKTPWNERIRLYLMDCGITDEEIAAFRDIMLEPVRPADLTIRGVFPLLVSPWTADARLDIPTLVKEAEFVERCGVNGIIWPTAGEVAGLEEEGEYEAGIDALAAIAERRGFKARLVATCPGATSAEELSRVRTVNAIMKRRGLKMAILARPPDDAITQSAIEAHYRALATIAQGPIIIQTYNGTGPQPDVSLLIALARDYPDIYGYVKEESPGKDVNRRIAELIAAKPVIHTVFSGWGLKAWLYQRRVLGTEGMITQRPAYSDILSRLWRMSETDANNPAMDEAYSRLLLMYNLGDTFSGSDDEMRGPHLHVLMRRGVFTNTFTRVRSPDAGSTAKKWVVREYEYAPGEVSEIDRRLAALKPYLVGDK